MHPCSAKIVLGSRSPRRLELLRSLVAAEWIRVLPPKSAREPDFQNLDAWPAIETRLLEVARRKCDDVLAQLKAERREEDESSVAAVISADTIIVAAAADVAAPRISGTSDDPRNAVNEPAAATPAGSGERLIVLGQPPADDSWREVVRDWFDCYYFGRTHTAATAFCVATPAGGRIERVAKTRVTFHPVDERLLDWYLKTGEPRGKAGGYALQGAGGVFVSRVEGSVSNVVGLPLRELLKALDELGIDVGPSCD